MACQGSFAIIWIDGIRSWKTYTDKLVVNMKAEVVGSIENDG